MQTTLLHSLREIAAIGGRDIDLLLLVAAYRRDRDAIGSWLFAKARHCRETLAGLDLPGWPKCECTCGCDEPATRTDDAGMPVCGACSDYATDDDGEVVCSRSGRTEQVTECCGAGGQTRSWTRVLPPRSPRADPAGEWACYWETAGDDAHVVSRHSTQAEAEQACDSHDWPPPGDHTDYLCGYSVRQLREGEWVMCEQDS